MDLYYQCGIADSVALLAEAGETMMPAAKKMCEIYNIKEDSISARDVIKASLPTSSDSTRVPNRNTNANYFTPAGSSSEQVQRDLIRRLGCHPKADINRTPHRWDNLSCVAFGRIPT